MSPSTRRMSPNCCSDTLHLGHQHQDVVGNKFPILAVQAPGLLTGIVNNVCARRTSVLSTPLWHFSCSSTGWRPGGRSEFFSWWLPVIRGDSQETLWQLTLSSSLITLWWSLSRYKSDKHSVCTYKDAAKVPTTHDNDELDTHDGLFKNYKSFHRLSGIKTVRLESPRIMSLLTLCSAKLWRTSSW